MKVHELVYSIDTISEVIEDLQQLLPDYKIFTFTGALGAGKTTLIQELLKANGIDEYIQSPTFTYMTPYTNASGYTFYHFDLYRLKSMQEFLNAGFQEYLYEPKSWALIEWPDIIRPLLKHSVCAINIDYFGDNQRKLRYELLA